MEKSMRRAFWNAERINSVVALFTTIVSALVTAFTPQIQAFMGHKPWLGAIVVSAFGIWNNLAKPVKH